MSLLSLIIKKAGFLSLLVFVLTVPDAVVSQNIFDVKVLEKDQGVQEPIVNHVVRDKYGFFYIFSHNYIQRYDGQNFETCDISLLLKDKINLSTISSITLLENGKISFQINEFLNKLYYIESGSLIVKSISIAKAAKAISNDKTQYLVHRSKTGLFQALSSPLTTDVIPKLLFTTEIEPIDIIKLEDNYYFTSPSNNVFLIKSDDKKTDLGNVGKIIKNQEKLYIINNYGIYKIINDNVLEIKKINLTKVSLDLVTKDDKGNIIIGFRDRPRYYSNMFVLDTNENLIPYQEILKISNTFIDIHSDDIFDKGMFVGFNGIYIISFLRDGIKWIHKEESKLKNEFGHIISGISVDKSDVVRFAQEGQNIYQFDKYTDEQTMLFGNSNKKFIYNGKLYYDDVHDIHLMYSYRYELKGFLYQFNHRNSTFEEHKFPFAINDLHIKNKDEVLLVGNQCCENKDLGVLYNYNLQTRTLNEHKLDLMYINTIFYYTERKEYWLATKNGIAVVDENFKIKITFSKKQIDSKNILFENIKTIHEFKGKILAGSYGGGIYVIDPNNYTVLYQINQLDGLTDNTVIGFVNDNLNNCWVSTFNGLNVLDSKLNIAKTIYDYDGLPSREFNTKSLAKDSEGLLYFGTINGLVQINPKKVLQWKNSNGLFIDKITSYTADETSTHNYHKNHLFYTSTDSISISFIVTDYFKYPFTYYQINSENVSKLPINHTRLGSVFMLSEFTKGDHNLLFKSKNSNYFTNLDFKINYNYNAILKYLALILCAILWMLFYIKRSTSITRKIEAEKTRVNKKISELQLNALKAQMNPHFIFNALSSINKFILYNDNEVASEYLTKFSRLIRQVLDNSTKDKITLTSELEILALYIELEQLRFNDAFTYTINVDTNINTDQILIHTMLIQPYIENAIWHGLLPKKVDCKLRLDVALDQNNLLINIEDNGIGRAKSAELKSKRSIQKVSHGMRVTAQRLEILNNQFKANIYHEVIDLKDQDNSPAGTKIVLHLPLEILSN